MVGEGKIDLIVPVVSRFILSADPEACCVEVEINTFDILAREEGEGMIYAVCAQAIVRIRRRKFERISKRQGWDKRRLLSDSHLRAQPVITDPTLRALCLRLPDIRSRVPTQ